MNLQRDTQLGTFSDGAFAYDSAVDRLATFYTQEGFGDIDGDGIDDLIFHKTLQTGRTSFRLVDSQDVPTRTADGIRFGLGLEFGDGNFFTEIVYLDYNGDGVQDMLVYDGFGDESSVVYLGADGFNASRFVTLDHDGQAYQARVLGDINGDGFDDIGMLESDSSLFSNGSMRIVYGEATTGFPGPTNRRQTRH